MKKSVILLIIIYIAFISLGLPDSVLGSAWPSMYGGFGVPLSYAGILTMITAGCTIISSVFSARLIKRFGTGLVTAVSVLMTAVALLGYANATRFYQLVILAVPYGLGAGSVDVALNHYVTVHYKARHMSWLHCFWGVGATAGPLIMGAWLGAGKSWNIGYMTLAIIQLVLAAGMFVTLPLWGKNDSHKETGDGEQEGATNEDGTNEGISKYIGKKGTLSALIAFYAYNALEATAGIWAASYLVLGRSIAGETAAKWASLFYMGITGGRLISGFITERFGDKNMIRLGRGVIALGLLLMVLPITDLGALLGLILIGVGCAPIYPCLIHQTPELFGKEKAQSMIGIQMASAYIGCTLMPPLFGIIGDNISIHFYSVYLIVMLALMFVTSEYLNRMRVNKNR